MTAQKVEVVNFKLFGDKVKAWVRGSDPLPATIEEFAAQLTAAGVGVKIPPNIKRVKFVQGDEETLVVKLPCKSLMEAGEARFEQEGGSYPLPAFYEKVFAAKPKIADKTAFHSERIGDYAIAQCA